MTYDASRQSAGLIDRARAGHRSALGHLFEEYTQFLFAVISKFMGANLRRSLEPADVVQETLLLATAQFDDFHGSNERELRAWLTFLAHRKLVDLARHNGRLKRAIKGQISLDEPRTNRGESLADQLPTDPCTASQFAVKRELSGCLAQALGQIDPREAEVLRLRYVEDMSFEAIGRQFGLGRNGVRGVVARGLRNLRRILPSF